MVDAVANFAYTTIQTAPSPPTSGTSVTVAAGTGSFFPTPPFNACCWPAGQLPVLANAEIVRVTLISTDTFTITRHQESTNAQSIGVGYQFANMITALIISQLEAAIAAIVQSFNTRTGAVTLQASDLEALYPSLGSLLVGTGSDTAQFQQLFNKVQTAINYSAKPLDFVECIESSTPQDFIITVPVTSGAPVLVQSTGTGSVLIEPASGKINSASAWNASSFILAGQGSACLVVGDGTNANVVALNSAGGDIASGIEQTISNANTWQTVASYTPPSTEIFTVGANFSVASGTPTCGVQVLFADANGAQTLTLAPTGTALSAGQWSSLLAQITAHSGTAIQVQVQASVTSNITASGKVMLG